MTDELPEELDPEEPRLELPPEELEESVEPEPELPRLLEPDDPLLFEEELLPDLEEEPLSPTPSFSLVCVSSVPVALRPCCC